MRSLPLVLVALMLSACANAPRPSEAPVRVDSVAAEPGPVGTDGEAELAANRQRWTAGRPTDYQLVYTRNCFCPPEFRGPFEVTVRDGAVNTVTYRGEGGPTERPVDDGYYTVDGLFDLLADAYDRNAASVRVTYDADTGQPTELFIDYDEQAADEEMGVTAEPVEPLGD